MGDFFGSLDAVLEGLGPPKTLKNQLFFEVFANVGFWYFGALDGPLGPILAPLGPIWSQNGSQNGSPDGSKSTPKSLKRGPLQVKNNLKRETVVKIRIGV